MQEIIPFILTTQKLGTNLTKMQKIKEYCKILLEKNRAV